jgi:hypothetical protein
MNTFKYLKIIIKGELSAFKAQFKESKLLFIFFLMVIAGLLIYLEPFPNKQINIATAYKNSDWDLFAKNAAMLLRDRGLDVSISNSEGAIDNVIQLDSKANDVNASFTYGGALDDQQKKGIYSLGSISYEPIWIFYRKDKTGHISDIKDLARYRVNLGPVNSGSYVIAKKLFAIYEIDVSEDRHFKSFSFSQMLADFKKGNSDAVVMVASYLDPTIQELLHESNVELIDFKNSHAYAKKFSFIEAVDLPAGSIDLLNTIPKKDTQLIATTASLVVRRDMHPDVQLALLMAAKDAIRNSPYLFFSKRNEFPAYVDPLIPISPVAQHFYDYGPSPASRYLPFWLAGFVDRAWLLILTLLALYYPLSKLNIHLGKFRYSVRKTLHYQELLAMREKLSNGELTEAEQKDLLVSLECIKLDVINAGAPIGMESDYFGFIYQINSLKSEIESLQSSSSP